jgi:8-oxo-dGTP diphosphatase
MKFDVIAAVIRKDGKFLVAKRSADKGVAAGYWCPITGRVEEGETQAETVVREVLEEVALTVVALEKIGELNTRDGRAVIHWWLTRIEGGEAKLNDHENTDLRWVTIAEMKKLSPTFPEDIAMFEVAADLLA